MFCILRSGHPITFMFHFLRSALYERETSLVLDIFKEIYRNKTVEKETVPCKTNVSMMNNFKSTAPRFFLNLSTDEESKSVWNKLVLTTKANFRFPAYILQSTARNSVLHLHRSLATNILCQTQEWRERGRAGAAMLSCSTSRKLHSRGKHTRLQRKKMCTTSRSGSRIVCIHRPEANHQAIDEVSPCTVGLWRGGGNKETGCLECEL